MRTRRDFLKSMALASLAGAGVVESQARAQSARPGIPFPQTDGQRRDALGCLGDPVQATYARDEGPRQDICAPSDGGLYQKEKIPVPEATKNV